MRAYDVLQDDIRWLYDYVQDTVEELNVTARYTAADRSFTFKVDIVDNNQMLLETQDVAMKSVATDDLMTVPIILLMLYASLGPMSFLSVFVVFPVSLV